MLFRILGISALAVTLTAATAFATGLNGRSAVVDIPYSVELHGKILPPGQYWLRDVETTGYQTDVIGLFDQNGQHFVASVMADPAYRVNPTRTNEVETGETANGTHYLQKIWFGTYNWGFQIPKSAMTN